eukprot:14510798-Alexandrium_andersonii.AAC.1
MQHAARHFQGPSACASASSGFPGRAALKFWFGPGPGPGGNKLWCGNSDGDGDAPQQHVLLQRCDMQQQ